MKAKEERSPKLLQCSHCAKEFRYNSEKVRHEASHFPHFECETCSKTFSFVSALRRHQKQHERTGNVPCKKCKRKFKDEVLLQRHIQYAHKGTFICEKCKSKFSSELALRTHMKTHQPESERRFKCSYNGCTKSFNFSHHLKHHVLTHTNAKQHFCSVCGKGFIQFHHLKSHMKSHDPSGRLSCGFADCKKEFSTDYARKRHMATHEIKLEFKDSISNDGTNSSIEDIITETNFYMNSEPTTPHEKHQINLEKCKIIEMEIGTDLEEADLTKTENTFTNITSVANIDLCTDDHTKANECKNKGVNDERQNVNNANESNLIITVNKGSSNNDSNIVKINNEDDVSNLYVEEWPSEPFKPTNYKTTTMASKLTNEHITVPNEVNDIECNKCLSSNQQSMIEEKTADKSSIVKVENGNECIPVEPKDMCEGCDCVNICNAKISMYDIPDAALPTKVDFGTNIEYINGVIKIRNTFDDDIVMLGGLSDKRLGDKRFVPFSTCKDAIGNCLMSGDSCLCARMMAVEDQIVMAQEIDDITPQPKTDIS